MSRLRILALALAFTITTQPAKPDVVYSTGTSVTAGTFNTTQGGVNSSNNLATATNPNNQGWGTGTMTATSTGTNTWTTGNGVSSYTTGGTNSVFRFQTGTGSGFYRLTALNWNGFIDGMNGNTLTITNNTGGTATWLLFQGTSTTALTSLTQNLSSGMTASGTGFGTPVFQASNFTSTYDLIGNTSYTLILNDISGMNLTTSGTGSANLAFETHMNFFNIAGSGSIGGTNGFSLTNAGNLKTGYTGTFTGSNFGSQNFAFDLQATAVPEPGTLAFSAIAGLFGFGTWWIRRKKPQSTFSDNNSLNPPGSTF